MDGSNLLPLDFPARQCAWCGSDISHRSHKAKFCSCICKRRSYRHHVRHVSIKKCRMCNEAFDASGRKHKRIVCSDECWRAWDRLKHARRNKRPVSLIGPLIPMKCRQCGKNHINHNGREGYCSMPCKAKAYAWSDAGQDYRKRFAATGYYREYARRRRAQAALATILLPTHKSPEENP